LASCPSTADHNWPRSRDTNTRRRLGALLLAVLLVALRPSVASAQRNTPLDAQCLAFADEVLTAVLESEPWDIAELARRGVPDVGRTLNEDSLSQRIFMLIADALGPLEQIDAPSVEVTITNRRGQRTTSCVYRANATFTNGPGLVTFRATVLDGEWRAVSLNVNA
jgi:hypothetical protein